MTILPCQAAAGLDNFQLPIAQAARGSPAAGCAAPFARFYNIAGPQQEWISNTYLHDFLLLDEFSTLIINDFRAVLVLFIETAW